MNEAKHVYEQHIHLLLAGRSRAALKRAFFSFDSPAPSLNTRAACVTAAAGDSNDLACRYTM